MLDQERELAATDLLLPAVELKGIAASSGGFRILHEVDVVFPAKECSVILGSAGSGKSTLLKVAAGLIVPDAGTALIQGKNQFWFSTKQEHEFRGTTGFVFQNAALWQNKSILDNVALPLRVHRHAMDEKEIYKTVSSLLRKLGYEEEISMRPSELSAGEQKLVSVARAVILEPSLIFMDDPTNNLDEDAQDRFFSLLVDLKSKKTSLVIVTNNTDLAYRFADNLGVLKNGRMVAFGLYDEVIAQAELALSGSFARLRARGNRAGRGISPIQEAGSEMSSRSDI